MFVAIPSRHRSGWRWATPLLFTLLWVAFLAQALADADAHRGLLHEWGALSGALVDVHAWRAAWADGAALRLVTALFLQFVRAPAPLLIGIWAMLQVVFTFIGPAFGAVAWVAHLTGFVFGVVFALGAKAGIARRLRKQRGL